MDPAMDTSMTRAVLDHFTDAYVQQDSDVIGVRVLAGDGSAYLSVLVRRGSKVDLPAEFESLPVRASEAVPGTVAAGPLR
jgi:hypothetical protein